jgi:NodT family efflux transporter outer membrane factor (OMF) lipoprotein
MKTRAVICLIFLTGCLSMSDREKKEHLAEAPSLEKSRIEGINSDLFTEGDWPDKNWWNTFESPILTAWIEEALAKNPNLKAVETHINQAKEMAIVARQPLFPTLYFNSDDNYTYLSENGFTHLLNPTLPLNGFEVDLSLAFNYEFDFWNQNRNTFRAALGELKAIEAEFHEAQLILSTSLAQAYFAILTTDLKKQLYERLVEVRTRRLSLQEKLLNSALVSALPPLINDEQVKEAKQMLLSMKDEVAIQSHLINVLMGKGPDEQLTLDNLPKTPPKSIPLPENLSIELLARRPDLMVQIWKAEALSFEVSVAKAEFFPNINLMAFAGIKSLAWNSLFRANSKTFGYRPALSLPIFTAGSIRANLRAKKAEFEQAIYQYNNLLLVSAQEVADMITQVQTVYDQKQLQEGVVLDAKARLDLTVARVNSGLDSQFAYLDYEETFIEKKIREVDYTYLQYAYLIKLIKSLGGGYNVSRVPITSEET